MKKKKKYQMGGKYAQGLAPKNLAGTPNVGGVTPTPGSVMVNGTQSFDFEEEGELDFHPLFKLFNGLALATTGIANKVSNARN